MTARLIVLSALFFLGKPDITGLIEVPARETHGNVMAILYTGDGGWWATDRGVTTTLADNGIPAIGLNTLRYFWTRRTPESAAEDFDTIVLHYLSAWKKDRVIVIGYSFGADVLPFILNRVPKSLLARVDMLVLLSPTDSVEFEFHIWQWFSFLKPKKTKHVLPEIQRLGNLKILAFCGDKDPEGICRELPAGAQKVIIPRSGHTFDRTYRIITQDILKEIHWDRVP